MLAAFGVVIGCHPPTVPNLPTPQPTTTTNAQPVPDGTHRLPLVMGAAPVAPPPELGFLVTVGALEPSLRRLAPLVPSMTKDLNGVSDELRKDLGEGIGSEVDLTRPTYWAMAAKTEEDIAFFTSLLHGGFGSALPATLQLDPTSGGVERLHVREGEKHPFLRSDTACDVYRAPQPNGALVCGPNPNSLSTLGRYLGQSGAQPAQRMPTLRLDLTPSFIKSPFSKAAPFWLAPTAEFASDVASLSVEAGFEPSSIALVAEWRFTSKTSAISELLVGARAAGKSSPLDFPEVPSDALFALALAGPSGSAKLASSLATDLASIGKDDPNAAELLRALTSTLYDHGGPLGIAYGRDLEATRARMKQWVAADAKDPAGSVPTGTIKPIADWFLLRLDDVELRAGAFTKNQSALVRVVALTGKDGLPKGAVHLSSSPRAAPRAGAPDAGPGAYHAFLVPRGKTLLIALSHDEDVARQHAQRALKADSAGAPFKAFFQGASLGQASGLGFVSPDVFVASSFNFDTSYGRQATLEGLEAVLAAPPVARAPAALEYWLDRATPLEPRARVAISFPNATVASWVPRLLEALDRL